MPTIATPHAGSESVEATARSLAETHQHLVRADLGVGLFERSPFPRALERARRQLLCSASKNPALAKAREWFLDNYYFLRRVARQVVEDLPRGFLLRLPRLGSGVMSGLTRVDVLAREIVVGDREIDLVGLNGFLDAYQEVSALSIAEVWALPVMLRTALLHTLLRLLSELDIQAKAPPTPASTPANTPSPRNHETDIGEAVGRCVRGLRILAEIDWKKLFESVSRVEAVFRRNLGPAYTRMDFDTCDAYRKAVEDLAWSTKRSEESVAQQAVTLSSGASSTARTRDVGYYLIGEGRPAFETLLGYRARGIERLRRAARARPTLAYLTSLAILTLAPLSALARYLATERSSPIVIAAALVIATGPLSVVAVAIVQRATARLLPPRVLPKLDFSRGVPDDARALVVIPTLLGRPADVVDMLRQIELHYLSNPERGLQFALLTDDVDSAERSNDTALLDSATAGITALNVKHDGNGKRPFLLLHRQARWNAGEECFMGWERKRGKLAELNHLLRGDEDTSYVCRVGDPKNLERIRYVITLDNDTQLPMGTAHRLVGLLAHPLNEAVFDEATGRVVSGFTIVQPRIETSPIDARRSWFAQIFAGDVGYDIYTRACSDFYQDLFGAGIYVGKGIYDVDAFTRSVDGRVPENAVASHDLLEGLHGRVALATDIVLFEGYPSHYATHVRRLHRWVRGDWQLVPWLFPSVPSASGGRSANRLSGIDRWKIFDNLRRSLMAPAFFVLLVSGWTWLPGRPLAWTLAILAIFSAPVLPAVVGERRQRADALARYGLGVTFLAHEASVVVDAILRVAVRMILTKKHLLEWTSAAHTAWGLAGKSQRSFLWGEMASSPILSVLVFALVAWNRPASIPVAAPLLVLWLAAPEIARWASAARNPRRAQPAPSDARRGLRLLARRTWMFFETFVGPNDQWLPVDNYQEQPHEQTAHRTSPTNIGMMFLSTLSAYDLGYLGPSSLALRLRNSLESVSRLEHYQGHLLNWYETTSLEPLLPRYVSTVDSGNLAGCLLAMKEGCLAATSSSVIRSADWEGLTDSLGLVLEALESLPKVSTIRVRGVIDQMRLAVNRAHDERGAAYGVIRELSEGLHEELRQELLALIVAGKHRNSADVLRSIQRSSDAFHLHLQQMQKEMEALLPWLTLQSDAAAIGLDLPHDVRLDEVAEIAGALRSRIDEWVRGQRLQGALSDNLEGAARRLLDATFAAEVHSQNLCSELRDLAAHAEREANGMDFRLLFDPERRLLHIGYNVSVDRVDANYYDLLASEARLASYLAIVKRDIPESHWYALGRPMSKAPRSPSLLSWGGTMFEYLMPALLMRSQEGTLLRQTCEHIVDVQIAYGKEQGAPWGISESAYAKLDTQETYQYRSFGVPGLGFKRGLEDDLVVAPYASFLALSIRPRAVVENATKLASMRMLGSYGMFEAVDLRPEHPTERRPHTVVRSYMAHHQGMILVAINNFLNDEIMVNRFHSDAMVQTGEVLLNERPPASVPAEWPRVETAEINVAPTVEAPLPAVSPWSPSPQPSQAFVVSNGVLTSLLTATGGGGLTWKGLALTRHERDPSCDADGLWLFARDEVRGHAWTTGSRECTATFSAHKIEFHRRERGISIHVEVTVAADDDAELRQVTIRNETDAAVELTLTSFGQPVLIPVRDAPVHPAFANMFVESEWEEELDALVFSRRHKTEEEGKVVLVHRLVRDESRVRLGGYESDRAALLGRGAGDRTLMDAATRPEPLGRHVGAILDPVMCLRASVHLAPKDTATLAFVTTVGSSRDAALSLARRYGSMHAVRWAFRDADPESRRRLQRAGVGVELLPAVQRLLSALLFVESALRSSQDAIAKGRPCKRHLWGRGISGDDPILVSVVRNVDSPLVRELIAAQQYLRLCDVRLDLVFIDERASGYVDESVGTLRSVITQCGADIWLNRHGGIFVFVADQLSPVDRLLLETSARVMFDTRDGNLSSQLTRTATSPAGLPRIEATHAEDPSQRPVVMPGLLFDNGFGGFTADGREYVIAVRPGAPTPAPWCNVLANPEFGCLVSESSLECTWSANSGENRLTPWRNDPVLDTPSEVLYLRDEETATVWSPTPSPAGHDSETLVRHGMGYTTYSRESHGLVQELTIFVPANESLKVARLRLKNTRNRHRRLTATYYAEWVLGSQREEQRPYIATELNQESACLLATSTWNAEFSERVAFLSSERDLHGWTADRREFLGDGGTYASPAALGRWGLSGSTDTGGDPCGALQVHLELAPGEEVQTHFVLGQARSREEAIEIVARFRDPLVVDASWVGLKAFWDRLLGNIRVKTPEPAMDLMLNQWLLYQTVSARFFGRTAFYQSSGAFGFRDQLQDILALLHASPERARAHILEAAAHQFEEGDVLHWWHPPEGRGVRTRCSDDMAWLPFVTAEYVSATGDAAILSENVAFLTGAPLKTGEHDRYAKYEQSTQPAPLFEHCRRALERALTVGPHGLPLMGDGDWNDGMNRVGSKGVGESVWLGWFLVATMDRFASLCARRSEVAQAETWRARARLLRETVEESAWDGAWYVRAFHDDGSRIGSATSRECQIDSIAQSWAVLAGSSNDARTKVALRSVEARLVSVDDRIVRLLAPPFDAVVHDPGYIRAYPPGVRENGGQYTHAATWLGFAYATLGQGEHAERVFRLLNPVLRTQAMDEARRYRLEPYVLAGDIYGSPPFVGRGGWSWYTGAAAWSWRLGMEAILGIRMEEGGLRIDPCIPPAWKGFEAWVHDAGIEIHVTVENPDGVSTGVAAITLDGSAVAGRRAHFHSRDLAAGQVHEVRIRLGSPEAMIASPAAGRPKQANPIGLAEDRNAEGESR